MRLVIIESPFAGDVKSNEEYARACVRDSLLRGEAPIASHLLYTQTGILDDDDPAQRQQGIAAGLEWGKVAELTAVYAELTAVYTDRGISKGMEYGIRNAREAGRPIEYRKLGDVTQAINRANVQILDKPPILFKDGGDLGLFTPDEPPKKKTPSEKFFHFLWDRGIVLRNFAGFALSSSDQDRLLADLADAWLEIVEKGEG